MAQYTEYHPLKFWLDPASIAEIVAHIQTYLVNNPINSTTEIETIIHDYLIAHPELIGGVDSVNGQTGEVVLTADNISGGENVTIKDVLDSLQDQIDDIVASIPSDYQQLIDDVSDLKSATDETDNQVVKTQDVVGGDIFPVLVRGKSIIAQVNSPVSFTDNANRMYIKFRANGSFSVYNLGLKRIAFIAADKDGVCREQTVWSRTDVPNVTGNPEYTYYVLCDFLDTTYIPQVKYDSGLVGIVNNLEINAVAIENGFTSAILFDWESGSILYPSGANKNPDLNVIRVKMPRFQLTGNIVFKLLNNKYRIKLYRFPDASGSGEGESSWYDTVGEYEEIINPSKYYRLQIATKTASSMNPQEALTSIVIAYSDNRIGNKFKSYWMADNYIGNKINIINQYLGDGTNKTAFLLLTDTHWNDNPTYLNSYGINPNLMSYIAERCNIQYLIHCGDINSEYRSNHDLAVLNMTRPVGMLREAFEHVLLTRGNHDDNNESGNKSWAYTISQSDSYSYMFRNTKDVVWGETGTYFYHDIEFDKVRIISLDGIDFPYTNDVDSSQLDEKLLAYGFNQLQWFCNALASTPSGWNIVVFTHEMVAPSAVTIDYPATSPQTRAVNWAVLANILKAYKNRSNYSESISGSFSTYHSSYYTGTLAKDFTSCDATIVGVFSGHEHIDCIEEILDGNGTGIGIYNTCTQNSSNLFADSVISHSYQHPMQSGTITELVWDVVIIDRKNKIVNMVRIGAYAANTDVEAVTVRTFSY